MFFKRKEIKKDSLEKALDLGLITREELLKLKIDRAKENYKKFLKTKKIRKK